MTENKQDEMIMRAARSYNAPPTVPRDEMWTAITAQRRSGLRIAYGTSGTGGPIVARFSRRVWLGAAAAAVFLLIGGVELGRWSVPSPVLSRTSSSRSQVDPFVTPPGTVTANPPDAGNHKGESRPTVVHLLGRMQVARTDARGAGPATRSPDQTAYRLVTQTHLSEAEAMLTSFRSRADDKMDASMADWARDLLTNTRLLLDSPAAADPRRRQLLEDLELTLVDIVQLSPGAGAQDRQMIEKNLDQGHVLTRLRTAIPAGTQKGS